MIVDVPGVAMAFDDLAVGSFFMFERGKREFGICVSDGQKGAAVILSTPERPNGHMPWLALGGLPHDAVVSFPAARLRAVHSDIVDEATRYGNLISAGGGLYMRVGASSGGYHTFNVQTGLLEKLPEDKPTIGYARWQVGTIIDDRFEPIFTFPATVP